MQDKELLEIARRHESLLIRLDGGEIDRELSSAIGIIASGTGAPVHAFAAQLIAIMKEFLFGTPIMPFLIEIKRAKRRKIRKPE